MKNKSVTKFIIRYVIPIFILGVAIGTIGGLIAQWLAQIFNLYETESKYELVLWAFVILGTVMGGIGGGQALLQFIRQKKHDSK